jgi:hypothetical protein
LHGNPLADKKNYRNFVVDAIGSLRQLDFSLVTEQNRDTSYTWRTFNNAKIKKLDKKLGIKARQQVRPNVAQLPAFFMQQ